MHKPWLIGNFIYKGDLSKAMATEEELANKIPVEKIKAILNEDKEIRDFVSEKNEWFENDLERRKESLRLNRRIFLQ